jgi:hypothetical protein
MSYKTNKKTKAKIDNLLDLNAAYQASQMCKTNSKTRREEINRYCRVQFINPIKEYDLEFFRTIQLG